MREIPTPLSDADFDRIARFVTGEANERERAEIGRWIDESAERSAELALMQAAWRGAECEAAVNVDAAWHGLSTRLGDSDQAKEVDNVLSLPSVRRSWRYTRAIGAAAAALVLIAGSVAVRAKLLKSREASTPSATPSQLATSFATAAGERKTVRLPDGSSVSLAPMSSLKLSERFSGESRALREVTLSGEALFDVVHDEAHPFRVNAGTAVIEDLGTEFVVRAYPGEDRLRVAVASGSVAVRRGTRPDSAKVLTPRDVAVVRDTGAITLSRDVDVSPFTAFTTGRLVFADAPLAEVARELTRWFGVDVRVSDQSLLERHLTATFEGDSLDTVLRVIGMTLNVRYDRTEQGVTFTGPGNGVRSGDASIAPAPPKAPIRREAGV